MVSTSRADRVEVADIGLVLDQLGVPDLQPDLRGGRTQPIAAPADQVDSGAERGQAGRGRRAETGTAAGHHDVDLTGERRRIRRPPRLAQPRSDRAVAGDDEHVQHAIQHRSGKGRSRGRKGDLGVAVGVHLRAHAFDGRCAPLLPPAPDPAPEPPRSAPPPALGGPRVAARHSARARHLAGSGQFLSATCGHAGTMSDTSARLLRLLSLLQARRDWPGDALAERLEVSARTVRRDVDRLRELGYPVRATKGPDGGYRLDAGADLPPLLFDDEQAVAVAVALQTATCSVVGIEEGALRALATVRQVMPARLRQRIDALQVTTVSHGRRTQPQVDTEHLIAIGAAVRAQRGAPVRLRRRPTGPARNGRGSRRGGSNRTTW